jgi:lipopolysaccharide export LptBFGC system permease protein LptF
VAGVVYFIYPVVFLVMMIKTMTLFDRYAILEMLQLLLLGTLVVIGGFYGTFEFHHMLQMMNETGMPFITVLTIMILQLPTGMIFCLPAGIVVATMLVLFRQSKDNEIVALQILGVSQRRVILPFLLMGVGSAILSYVLCDQVAPQARDLSRRLLIVATRKSERPLSGQSTLKLEDKNGKVEKIFLFNRGQGARVDGFVNFDLKENEVNKLVCARSAQWRKGGWTLEDGNLYEFSQGEIHGAQLKFAAMQVAGGLANSEAEIEKHFKTTLDKTTAELLADINLLKGNGAVVPPYLEFQYWRRYSQPISCFFLVLATSPLILIRKRRRADFPLLYGGVLVVVYFFLQEICMSLVVNDHLAALPAACIPPAVLFVISLSVTAVLKRL